MNKFRNKKTVIDGITFDSIKESKRYGELKLMHKAGAISDLTLQPRFDIDINGHKVCKYFGDFAYDLDGVRIVEDVKSEHTRKLPAYRLKKKLLKAVHGIEITEV